MKVQSVWNKTDKNPVDRTHDTLTSGIFFLKDRIDLENLDVQHCPTEQMLADFFTKPLQGSLFRKFREVIMGHKHINSLKVNVPNPLQEHVGQENLLGSVGNGLDQRRTDANTRKPHRVTYAAIAKRGAPRKSLPLRTSILKVRGKE